MPQTKANFDDKNNPPAWAAMLAGGIGGACGAIATTPLDLLKTRYQSIESAQWKNVGTTRFGFKTISTLNVVYRQHGVRGIFKGLVPTLMGVVPARALYFTLYNKNRTFFSTKIKSDSLVHLLSAFVGGCTASCVLNPIWVVKTRWQLQDNIIHSSNNTKPYRSVFDCARRIFVEEGMRGLYKGLTLSCIGASEGAIHFVVYERLKQLSRERRRRANGGERDGVAPPVDSSASLPFQEYLLFASVARIVATSLTYPHEVLRTRVREEHVGGTQYTSVVRAFKSVVKQDGVSGLYRGIGVHMMRVVPNAAILFTVYEFVLKTSMRFSQQSL